ncbi:hypothetical protein FV242_22970 [Methylobacterium sp. WL64]|uniref:hypothetical protein n=1 Tax=Methylobacterium sp. WL64 TaxID=2603894 RepID=UPI0011C93EC4|nr:hypothetical protein [Methylobacterium sp. WL64]TXN00159.1 hypothetical protein FV242_22970 [Methylobacterium sp. WL64]
MPDTKNTHPGLIARMRARYAEQSASGELARARRIGAIGIPIGLLLLGGYRILNRPDRNAIAFTVGVMPACDSIPARRLLRQVLEQAAAAKQPGATVQRLGVVQETGYVPVGAKGLEIRLCQADAFLSVGRSDVPFTLEWTTPAKDELWIEAEPPF